MTEPYRDTTHRAPLRPVLVRRWLPSGWITERLACGHPVNVYRPPFTPRAAKRRCLICVEVASA